MSCNINGKDLLIINTHLVCTYGKSKDDLEFQQKQFEELTKYIKVQHTDNIIMAGDFNSDPNSQEMLLLEKELALKDSLSPAECTVDPKNLNRGWLMSWFSDGKPYRTDYILTSKGITVQKSEVIFKEHVESEGKKVHLSDHFAVFAELEV